jgi:hypothetical protein
MVPCFVKDLSHHLFLGLSQFFLWYRAGEIGMKLQAVGKKNYEYQDTV